MCFFHVSLQCFYARELPQIVVFLSADLAVVVQVHLDEPLAFDTFEVDVVLRVTHHVFAALNRVIFVTRNEGGQ